MPWYWEMCAAMATGRNFFSSLLSKPCTSPLQRLTLHIPKPTHPYPKKKQKKRWQNKQKHPVGMIRNICTRKATFLVLCSLKRLFQTKCKKSKEEEKRAITTKTMDLGQNTDRETNKINKNIAFCSKEGWKCRRHFFFFCILFFFSLVWGNRLESIPLCKNLF